MSTMWDHQVGSTYSTRLLTIKRTSKAGWKSRLCIDAAIYMNTEPKDSSGLDCWQACRLDARGDFPVLVLRQANKDLKMTEHIS